MAVPPVTVTVVVPCRVAVPTARAAVTVVVLSLSVQFVVSRFGVLFLVASSLAIHIDVSRL